MGFYFIVHFLMGMAAGASAWTFRCAKEDPLGVPAWALGPWGLASAAVASLSALADVSGTAIVVGGNTLSIAGIKVRLNGIATPKKRSNG